MRGLLQTPVVVGSELGLVKQTEHVPPDARRGPCTYSGLSFLLQNVGSGRSVCMRVGVGWRRGDG